MKREHCQGMKRAFFSNLLQNMIIQWKGCSLIAFRLIISSPAWSNEWNSASGRRPCEHIANWELSDDWRSSYWFQRWLMVLVTDWRRKLVFFQSKYHYESDSSWISRVRRVSGTSAVGIKSHIPLNILALHMVFTFIARLNKNINQYLSTLHSIFTDHKSGVEQPKKIREVVSYFRKTCQRNTI